MQEWLGALAGILLVDLALSGDNALVIGAAAAGLPAPQRRLAIWLGGAGAVVLRIGFAMLAALLLSLPLVQAIGGLVLLVIAVRLLLGREAPTHQPTGALQEGAATIGTAASTGQSRGLRGALVTVLVADVTMSLDNILALGALAHGNLPLLAVGLVISIAFLLIASSLVAALIARLPLVLDAAALVLGWTAGTMILHDTRIAPLFNGIPANWQFVIPLAATLIVLLADIAIRLLRARRASQLHASTETTLPR